MEEDLFKEEKDFYCSICGKKIKLDEEINEELCDICLTSLLEDVEKTDNDEIKKSQ